ncbi:MAG TPA: mechanosensitive ion channel domain-containing protein, partial [Ktedonobacteraceae bacterium]|nr:mechanosensitive ion channel domain-containing protein [Ktedonobacteraceae bacterium]
FLIIIPPIIVGIVASAFYIGIKATDMLLYLQLVLPNIFNMHNFGQIIWNLALSVFIFLLAIGVGRTLLKVVKAGTATEHIGVNISVLIGRICYTTVLCIAVLLILTIWNIQFGIPAAVISVITVGLTFVLQDLLKNIVAGIYILVEGPFHIGDVISTDVFSGKVEDVQLRATKLRIVSGEQVIVPNSMLFTGIVVNKTIYGQKRSTIGITLPLDKYDKQQTSECILKTIKGVTGVMIKPEPTLSLSSVAGAFGSSTGTVSGYTGEIITLTLRFWIPEEGDAPVSDAMLALRESLPYADLSIREPAGF